MSLMDWLESTNKEAEKRWPTEGKGARWDEHMQNRELIEEMMCYLQLKGFVAWFKRRAEAEAKGSDIYEVVP